MDKYKMTGTVLQVGPIQLMGQNKFRKREVVLCDNPDAEYPHKLLWEFTQDKISLVNESQVGAKITIEGYPESRAWTDKSGNTRWFTSLRATAVNAEAKEIILNNVANNADNSAPAEDPDDMPF